MCFGSIPGPPEAPLRAGFCSFTLEDGLRWWLSSYWYQKLNPLRPCCGSWHSATAHVMGVSGEHRPWWVTVRSVCGVQGQSILSRKGKWDLWWVWLSLTPRVPKHWVLSVSCGSAQVLPGWVIVCWACGWRCFPLFTELTGDQMLRSALLGSTEEMRCSPSVPKSLPLLLLSCPGCPHLQPCLAHGMPCRVRSPSRGALSSSEQGPGWVGFHPDLVLSCISQQVLTLLPLFRILTKVITWY